MNWKEIAITIAGVLSIMWLFDQRIQETENRLVDLMIASTQRDDVRILDLTQDLSDVQVTIGVAITQARDEIDDLCERVNALHGARGSCRSVIEK